MGIRTTLLLRSECKRRQLPEPYIVTELFNSANTVFVDATSWGGHAGKESHYTLSPVFSEGKIYTNELNDTLLGMSYYVPRMAEVLVQMIDGPSKLRHYAVPSKFIGKTYIEMVRYLQSHETIAVAVVSKGLAIGVEQRSSDDLSLRTACTLWKMVCSKKCTSKNRTIKQKEKKKRMSLKQTKNDSSIYTKQSWSRMELMTLTEKDFDDPRHQCVITCPPDNRLLTKGDKILVLRPFEESPEILKLGSSKDLFEDMGVDKMHVNEKEKKKMNGTSGSSGGGGGGGGGGGKQNERRMTTKNRVPNMKMKSFRSSKTVGPETENSVIHSDLDDLTRLTMELELSM